jgi:zinc D-Ala-D-Ala carboxypeptidase
MNYFTLDEFDSPDVLGSGENMDVKFLELLDYAREEAMTSFKINSGYRTPERNAKVGGVANSSHIKGCAADISCTSSAKRLLIVQALINVGFTRIGIAGSFIHVDNDPDKNDAIWLY